jgi:hypothetical protein
VNDLLFRERLSIFPVLSRKASLEIGVCFPKYRRYRIDDHVFDTYNMLALLGYRRIVYLPDVVFEHLNHQTSPAEGSERFVSEEGKVYAPNPEIMRTDAALFDSLLETRKKAALMLARLIEGEAQEKRAREYQELLGDVRDFSYRASDFVRLMPLSTITEAFLDSATVQELKADDQPQTDATFGVESHELESICARLPRFQSAVVRELTILSDRCRKQGQNAGMKFFDDINTRIKSVSLKTSSPNPVLLESYRGHNLVHYLYDILVVPISLGPLNVRTERDRPEIVPARSLEAAKQIVDDLMLQEVVQNLEVETIKPLSQHAPEVELLIETPSYHLLRAGTDYLAVSNKLGPTELFQEKVGERELGTLLLRSKDLVELQNRVQNLEAESTKPLSRLVKQVGHYNLLSLGDYYVAVSLELGPTKLLVETIGERELGGLLLVDTHLDRLEERVDEILKRPDHPTLPSKLLFETLSYNIVQTGNHFVAVAKELGPTILFGERLGERDLGKLVLRDSDLVHLRQRIAEVERQTMKPLRETVQVGDVVNQRTGIREKSS